MRAPRGRGKRSSRYRSQPTGIRVMSDEIAFYSHFSSPYGCLASRRIERLAQAHGRDVLVSPATGRLVNRPPRPLAPLRDGGTGLGRGGWR